MTTMRVPRRQRLQIAVHQYQHALYNAAIGLVLQHMQKKEIQRKASKKRLWRWGFIIPWWRNLKMRVTRSSSPLQGYHLTCTMRLWEELGQGFRNNTHFLGKPCHLVSRWPSPSGSLALVYPTTAWPMSSDVLTIPSAWSSLRLVRPSLLNTWRSRLNVQKHQRSGKEWHEAFQRDGTYTSFVGH